MMYEKTFSRAGSCGNSLRHIQGVMRKILGELNLLFKKITKVDNREEGKKMEVKNRKFSKQILSLALTFIMLFGTAIPMWAVSATADDEGANPSTYYGEYKVGMSFVANQAYTTPPEGWGLRPAGKYVDPALISDTDETIDFNSNFELVISDDFLAPVSRSIVNFMETTVTTWEELQDAWNAVPAGGSATITVPTDTTITMQQRLTLTNGRQVTINGDGTLIFNLSGDRHFEVGGIGALHDYTHLILAGNITITRSNPTSMVTGGGIRVVGTGSSTFLDGIATTRSQAATLEMIENATITGNRSPESGGAGGGVGVEGGIMVMRDNSRVVHNTSDGMGGGVALTTRHPAGPTQRSGLYMFDNSSVSFNTTGTVGGGVSIGNTGSVGGELVMFGGSINNNNTTTIVPEFGGGGISPWTGDTLLFLEAGEIRNNTARAGGGIFFGARDGGAHWIRSTEHVRFNGNHATTGTTQTWTLAEGLALFPSIRWTGYDAPDGGTSTPGTYIINNDDINGVGNFIDPGPPPTPDPVVTFNINGGTTWQVPLSGIANVIRTVEEGAELSAVIPVNGVGIPIPLREGYQFTGWNIQADGLGVEVTANTIIIGSITVYAQWELISTYSVCDVFGTSPDEGFVVPSVREPIGEVIYIDHVLDFARIGRDANFPLNGHYILTADIDLRDLANLPVNQIPTTGTGTAATNNRAWHATRGWLGIGPVDWLPLPATNARAFTGVLDGNGHTISGLWMNRTDAAAQMGVSQGLFRILRGAEVRDLTIELDSRGIVGTGERRGVLAGNAFGDTIIYNVHVIGNGATIGATSGVWNYHGGIVGELRNSVIINSSVTDVNVVGFSYIGGITGVTHNSGNMATRMFTRIQDTTVTDVSVRARGSYAGGVGGAIYDATTIVNTHVDGANVRTTLSYAGGFAGVIGYGSHVQMSSVINQVVRADLEYAGGFVGALYGLRREGRVAELCGVSSGIYGNFADVRARNFAGGFAGIIYDHSIAEFASSYADVHVARAYAGGFSGRLDRGRISNAYAHGTLTVTGTLNHTSTLGGVGGFVGNIATINSAHIIHNSYANVNFNLPSNYSMTRVGGFIGRQGSTGFRVDNHHSFFNSDTVGLRLASGTADQGSRVNNSPFINGRTTDEMQDQSTFIGWDFDNIWTMNSPHGHPVFR